MMVGAPNTKRRLVHCHDADANRSVLPRRYVQAELVHARFAMLGYAGIVIPEALTKYGLWDIPPWYEAGASEFEFADAKTLLATQFILMGFAEYKRLYDFRKPGSQGEAMGAEGFAGTGVNGYPGGFFDPLGLSKTKEFEKYKVMEIANGRAAMLAMAGIYGQTTITGLGPLAALEKHRADPWHVSVLSEMTTKLCSSSLNYGAC